jgi:hypothetical protein
MSPLRTGPFTLRTRVLFWVPMKLTLTCVIPPLEPAKSVSEGVEVLTGFTDDFFDVGVNEFS